jgi:hypothetical protein
MKYKKIAKKEIQRINFVKKAKVRNYATIKSW